ncbi:hypothetical protein SADUNF_Sadunf08G0094100 [Salix dunnii]|uniref:Uncharacterized protein n=1 Tax=Salix dunnii TaxID=1413687 RepID=A0A835JZW8_9ROSI|nr:hypothetical protein SADUNF_Sadunf08G0094100 [Salix dunnii]
MTSFSSSPSLLANPDSGFSLFKRSRGSGKATSAVFAAQLSVFNNITGCGFYLKYLRNLAEKTYLGRLAGPSFLRLVGEALSLSGSKYNFNGKTSAEIWDSLERILEEGSSAFSEPSMFGQLSCNGP